MAKYLTDDEKRQILALRNKRSGKELAKMFGVSTANISNVLSGKSVPSSEPKQEPKQKKDPQFAALSVVLQASRVQQAKRPPATSEEAHAQLARSLRGETLPPTPPTADPLPEVPESVPEGADVALVDKWIALVEEAAKDARTDDNMTAFASLTAKLVALLEHRRKVTPVAKADPNDSPDMIALGEQVWLRLKKALDG